MNGWIKLHRKLLDWEWYHDNNVKLIFLHLLLKSNYEEKEWQGIVISRGELVTSIKNLAEETNLTIKQTRISIDKLKKTNEIVTKGANKYTIITICKYDSYQVEEDNEGQTKGEQKASKRANKRANKGRAETPINMETQPNEGQTKGEQKGEQRASKRATTKEYKKDINKEINKESEEDVKKSLLDFEEDLLYHMPQRCQAIMMNNNLTKDDYLYYLAKFCNDCLAIGKKHGDINDFVSHFINWLPTGKKKYERTVERPEMEKFKQYGIY